MYGVENNEKMIVERFVDERCFDLNRLRGMGNARRSEGRDSGNRRKEQRDFGYGIFDTVAPVAFRSTSANWIPNFDSPISIARMIINQSKKVDHSILKLDVL